jgi:hypothetical protein
MGLTWKDGVTTVSLGVMAAVYMAFLHGTGLWLISSARGATLAVLALGIIGGCTVALAVLVAATGALSLGATVRHAVMAPPVPPRNRDTHEVIRAERAARH